MRIWSCGWCIVALVVVVWCLCLHKCTSLLFWDKLLFQIYLIVNLLLTLKDYYNVTNTTIVTFIGSDSCVSYQRICHVSTPRWFGWACVDTSIYRQPHCAYSFCGWGVQNGIWAIVPKAPPLHSAGSHMRALCIQICITPHSVIVDISCYSKKWSPYT